MAGKKNYAAKDHYQDITDAIVASLEAGVAPWTCPWDRSLGLPRNGHSGHIYQGINTWLCFARSWAEGWTDPRFFTFNQMTTYGAHIPRGTSGTKIVHWRFSVPKQRKDETDEDYEARKHNKVPILSVYTLFNVAQIEWGEAGPPKATKAEPVDLEQVNAEAAEFLNTVGAVIKHGGGKAAYNTKTDTICLPAPEAFKTVEDYLCTAFHEVIHWTGAKGRCDRKLTTRFGTEAYAAEELVAELGAAFLCADYGIEGKLQHPEYIGHWLKVLKGDKYAVFTAARLARDAATFTKVKLVEKPADAEQAKTA